MFVVNLLCIFRYFHVLGVCMHACLMFSELGPITGKSLSLHYVGLNYLLGPVLCKLVDGISALVAST